jgi:hypothetical protein
MDFESGRSLGRRDLVVIVVWLLTRWMSEACPRRYAKARLARLTI